MEELEAEMKLLNWHKLANEAALKAALIRTKKLRKMDKSPPSKSLQDKAAWMQQVQTNQNTGRVAGDAHATNAHRPTPRPAPPGPASPRTSAHATRRPR